MLLQRRRKASCKFREQRKKKRNCICFCQLLATIARSCTSYENEEIILQASSSSSSIILFFWRHRIAQTCQDDLTATYYLPFILHRQEAPHRTPPTISFLNLRCLGFPKAALGNPKNPKRVIKIGCQLMLHPS